MNWKTVTLIIGSSLLSAILAVFIYSTYMDPLVMNEGYLPVKLTNYNDALLSGHMQRKFLSSEPNSFAQAAAHATQAVVYIRAFQNNGVNYWESGTGSGVIISPDGYVITNNHVIENADDIEITLNDNKEYSASLIGTDPNTDIAVVRIDEKALPHMVFGNSDSIYIGEWVLAVGNPFNLQSTVTAGIISAKSRSINVLESDNPIESFIQTDAVVNPGNSGGALVNANGELIGINTAIVTESGNYEGYSFAIPSNLAQKVIKDIIDYGKVHRGYLGASIEELDPQRIKQLDLAEGHGVIITSINSRSAAQEAGLEVGDIILKINNEPIMNVAHMQEVVARHRPGRSIQVEYFRNNRIRVLDATLKSPKYLTDTEHIREALKPILAQMGMTVRVPQISEKLKFGANGILVTDVVPESLIDRTNMVPYFYITHINEQPVESLEDLLQILSKDSKKIEFEGVYHGFDRIYVYTLNMP